MRTTCLYCEHEGVTTPLVRIAQWGCCPIHSKDYIREATTPPEGYAYVRRPVLTDRGIPNRN